VRLHRGGVRIQIRKTSTISSTDAGLFGSSRKRTARGQRELTRRCAPCSLQEGLLNATLLKEYVEEKTGNLVNEFKGQVKEAKADDKLKEVVQEAKDATEGASASAKVRTRF
jgi:hypothetical protein